MDQKVLEITWTGHTISAIGKDFHKFTDLLRFLLRSLVGMHPQNPPGMKRILKSKNSKTNLTFSKNISEETYPFIWAAQAHHPDWIHETAYWRPGILLQNRTRKMIQRCSKLDFTNWNSPQDPISKDGFARDLTLRSPARAPASPIPIPGPRGSPSDGGCLAGGLGRELAQSPAKGRIFLKDRVRSMLGFSDWFRPEKIFMTVGLQNVEFSPARLGPLHRLISCPEVKMERQGGNNLKWASLCKYMRAHDTECQ